MKMTLHTVSTKTAETLQVENEARGFKLTLDEPVEMGGSNTGMNPLEAMLCGLGGCQCIVATAFAQAQNFKYEKLSVEVDGDWDPEGFMGLADVRNGLLEVRVRLHVKSNEPAEKVKAFADFIESRCPVADCLINGVKIVKETPVID